jgi:hypothetical protein
MVVSINLDAKSETILNTLARENGISKSELVRQMLNNEEDTRTSYDKKKLKRLETAIENLMMDIETIKIGQKALFEVIVNIHQNKIKEIVEQAVQEGKNDTLVQYILREKV